MLEKGAARRPRLIMDMWIDMAGVVVTDIVHLKTDKRQVIIIEDGLEYAMGIGRACLGVECRNREAHPGGSHGDATCGKGIEGRGLAGSRGGGPGRPDGCRLMNRQDLGGLLVKAPATIIDRQSLNNRGGIIRHR